MEESGKTSLFVANISPTLTQDNLKDLFSQFGTLTKIEVLPYVSYSPHSIQSYLFRDPSNNLLMSVVTFSDAPSVCTCFFTSLLLLSRQKTQQTN